VTKRSELFEKLKQNAAAAAVPIPVDVPGWGRVYVRSQTVEEADALTKQKAPEGRHLQLAFGAAQILCDETGARLFEAGDMEAVELLAKQPWSALRKVLNAVSLDAEDDVGGKAAPAGTS
jgi:hypothetical protein